MKAQDFIGTRPMGIKTYRIGRDSGNDIIYSRPEISGSHAELIFDGSSYTLIDHSKNGTIVNGIMLNNNSRRVSPGDSIVFAGKERFDWGLLAGHRSPTVGIEGGYGGGMSPADAPTAPLAVASMVCGIASLVLSVSPWIALALAIVGLSLGVTGTKRIRGQEHLYKGIGMLKAGKICSIITLGLIGLAMIIGLSLGIGLLSLMSEFF